MRCSSCGFMNNSQALECTQCKKLLDPIAAAATVGNTPPPAPHLNPPSNLPHGRNNPPARPSLPNSSLPPTPSTGIKPTMSSLPSKGKMGNAADVDFLADSSAAGRIKEGMRRLEVMPFSGMEAPIEIKCGGCGKILDPTKTIISQVGIETHMCLDCEAKATLVEENAPKIDARKRAIMGFIVGLVATIICIGLASLYGVNDLAKKQLNWHFLLAMAVIIGIGVRIGARNKAAAPQQLSGFLLTTVGVIGALYMGMSSLGIGFGLASVFELFGKQNIGTLVYGVIGLSILLGYVIPSSVFGGGEKEPDFEMPHS